MHTNQPWSTLVLLVACLCTVFPAGAVEHPQLGEGLLFHASFDHSADADVSKGDGRIYTANSLKREQVQPGLQSEAVTWSKKGGRTGGALHFTKKSPKLVFFQGGRNVPFAKIDFEGTVSLWLRLTPTEDLPAGYVDPLQITDKTWNDASFFVDFDQAKQRDFRLGAFADYKFWNPTDRKFDDVPTNERPMVFVQKPPFRSDKWTHVAFTWRNFNSDQPGIAVLYLDGKAQGTIHRAQRFTWNPGDVVIMLGINYVGWLDDLAIYKNALSAKEVQLIADGKGP